jgi:hypothetical protein
MSLKKIYRKDLTEETVNLIGVYDQDRWKYQTEDIAIPQFKNKSDRAVVIGNGVTANEFDLTKFLPYRELTPWGEVTSWLFKKQSNNFYTYGCNALYRNYKPDFLICTGEGIVKEIAENNQDKTEIVYANSKFLEKYPGKFNFLPQNPNFDAGAIAAYMAAFDGQKKIYMIGFDGIDSETNNYNMFAGTANYPALNVSINESYWIRSLTNVMTVYSDTEFIRVCPTKNFRQPESWKDQLNYRQITFRQFVLEADI